MITAPTARVVSVIDHLYRDQRIADLVLDGCFEHGGHLVQLSMPPDWTRSPIADDEWRIEWVKCYEGLDLAYAFSVNGDTTYLSAWIDLVTSFCDQVPVGYDSSDVSARRMQNWLYAWQRFAATPGFPGLPGEFITQLSERLLADADHLAANLTKERNHRTLELYSLLLVGIAFNEQERALNALELLADNAVADISEDGVQRELSTDYHGLVLRSLVGAIVNCRVAGLDIPDRLIQRANLAATVAMHWQRPDGITPAVSDGDETDFRQLLLLASEVLDRADLRFVATHGADGVRPDETCPTFSIGGYAVQRSGWGDGRLAFENEWWALMDIGPIGAGGHGHYDQLSVLLYANGSPLVVDPGRYTYEDEADGWRHYFKGTAAHNTVNVDGLDQTPYRRGKPKGPQSSVALLGRSTQVGSEGLVCDRVVAEVTSPSYPARHRRSLEFRPGDRWRIVDELWSPVSHRYELRWHLPAEASGGGSGRVSVDNHDGGAVIDTRRARFAISSADGGPVCVSIEQGWVSPTYGKRFAGPIISATQYGSAIGFVTEVTPT